MPRAHSGSDFKVDVDGIGQFTFARRTMRDQFRIRGEYGALTNGHYDADGQMMDIGAFAYATIQILIVSAPQGFSLEDLDPNAETVEAIEAKVMKIFAALRDKEGSFRTRPPSNSETASEATSQ